MNRPQEGRADDETHVRLLAAGLSGGEAVASDTAIRTAGVEGDKGLLHGGPEELGRDSYGSGRPLRAYQLVILKRCSREQGLEAGVQAWIRGLEMRYDLYRRVERFAS